MKKYAVGLAFLMTFSTVMPSRAQIDTLSSTSVLVCRAHQCANAPYSMTKGFLFNKIAQMMEQNIGKTVLVCEADPTSHVCLQEGLSVPSESAISPIDLTIQKLRLVDEKKLNGATGLDLVFDYQIQADKTYPSCELGLSRLNVSYTDKVELTTRDFICHVTETGRTSVNATYNINYLDFDYGFIGAYYTIGVGEAVQGDRTGYALFRFTGKPAPETPKVKVAQPQSKTSPLPVPDILKETAAATTQQEPITAKQTAPAPKKTESVVVKEKTTTPKKTEPTHQKTVSAPEPAIRILPEIVIQPVQTEQPVQQPTVIKTTTIEKTVITSDGKRHVTPPETRTIIDGKIQ